MQGVIQMNDTLLLGPTSLGEFIPVSIRGIHRKRLPVGEVRGGQTASFALKKVHTSSFIKDTRPIHCYCSGINLRYSGANECDWG